MDNNSFENKYTKPIYNPAQSEATEYAPIANPLICPMCGAACKSTARFCKNCGHNFRRANPSAAMPDGFPLQELRKIVEQDKINYEAALKKYKKTTLILIIVIISWIVLYITMGIVSSAIAPPKKTKTVPVEYDTYSQNAEIGDEVKIEITSGVNFAQLTTYVKQPYVTLSVYKFYLVQCADGSQGILKINSEDEGDFLISLLHDEPVTFYGVIVDVPDAEFDSYSPDVSLPYNYYPDVSVPYPDISVPADMYETGFNQPADMSSENDDSEKFTKELLNKYKIVELDPEPVLEREVEIEQEKTWADLIHTLVTAMFPAVFICFIVLIKRKKPCRKYPDLPPYYNQMNF